MITTLEAASVGIILAAAEAEPVTNSGTVTGAAGSGSVVITGAGGLTDSSAEATSGCVAGGMANGGCTWVVVAGGTVTAVTTGTAPTGVPNICTTKVVGKPSNSPMATPTPISE